MNAIQISNPFPSTLNPPSPPPPTFTRTSKLFFLAPRSVEGESKAVQTQAENGEEPLPAAPPATSASDESFENRLAQVRVKYRSGTGKKAEKRRSKKSGVSTGTKKSGTVMLPPVPLKEPVNASGLKVELGFTPYTERLNGRLAALGLAALLLVELGSGKGILKYHPGPILFIQIYTVAAAAAVFVKYEKERISIWPEKAPIEQESSTPVIGD